VSGREGARDHMAAELGGDDRGKGSKDGGSRAGHKT
jgi:hypothetical protein